MYVTSTIVMLYLLSEQLGYFRNIDVHIEMIWKNMRQSLQSVIELYFNNTWQDHDHKLF